MFTNLYPPVCSGSALQVRSLSRELTRRGCQTIVITARIDHDSAAYEQVDGVHVYRLPAIHLPEMAISLNFPWLNYTFTPCNLWRMERIIRRHDPDVLHLHNHMFDMALSAILMRRRTGKPLVLTIHTIIRHARWFYNALLYPADRLVLRHLVVGQADNVICPDLNAEAYVREAFGDVPRSVIPYGIDIFPPSPQGAREIRDRFGLAGKRVILSLGHVHHIRNRKELVEAMPEVLRAFPNAVLLIVGAVSTDFPAALARKLGVQDSVIFTGAVSHATVPALFTVADLEAHWLNQEVPEKTSLGIASWEAMGAGKVILTTAKASTRGEGALEHGRNGILVEPNRPDQLARFIIELLGDDERRKAIGAAARKTIRDHFSWDVICRRMLTLYADTRRTPPPISA